MRRTESSSCTAGEPAWLRRARSWCHAGVHDVHVDGQEHPIALIGRDRERLAQALVQAPADNLGHLEAAHALAGHPVQRLRLRPVTPQAYLEESVTADSTRLDQAAHRRAVAVQGAELGVASVGMRVEVDHGDPTPADMTGYAGSVRQCDCVIAAEYDRDRSAVAGAVDGFLKATQRLLGIAREHLDVARVGHLQLDERIHAKSQVRPGPVVGQVVGEPNGLRAKARARSVRCPAVERRPDDHDVGASPGRRICQVGALHAEECRVGAVHAAKSGHVANIARPTRPGGVHLTAAIMK